MPLLGSLYLPGFNADIWAHGGFAYIGTWGSPTRCPATGVRVIDLADPRQPVPVGALATIRGASQEDVEVLRVETAAFSGDLLVTGIQACTQGSDAPRGLDLWDVSDPREPRHLAFWSSGPAGPGGARGVHELHLFQRGDRAYVAAAVPFSESIQGEGDFRIVDVTDPRNPVQVGAWGATADAGLRPAPGQTFYAHSAWTDRAGTRAVLSYWDAGAILLDIGDPTKPALLGRTPYPPGADGDTHSAWFAQGETVLLTTDEELRVQGDSWGFSRLWDLRGGGDPVEIGRFGTPDALAATRRGPGVYSAHNPVVRGNTAYLSWFADGVRVLDIADPRAPREIAHYVPPATADPYGEEPTDANVWGVFVAGDLLLLSDINAGLYVLEAPRAAPPCFPETGHCLGERFYDAWHAGGGLPLNGYPIGPEMVETLEDGRQYTVQYFERTRLEHHPENRPPHDIQLGQFGRRIHPADPPAAPLASATYVPETGHNLGGRFRDYWQQHGGLARFGFPISEEFEERLEDGRVYRVQYFERARFEHHPENEPPYDVLLGQFGRRILAGR